MIIGRFDPHAQASCGIRRRGANRKHRTSMVFYSMQTLAGPRAAGRRAGLFLLRLVAAALLLTLAACSLLSHTQKPTPDKNAPRAQLSIGYSLLYHEADGIPKLKWILMFKDKPEEMGQVTNDLVSYYQQLADTLQRLSKQFPAMRIDVEAMSEIEAEERKAIGADTAKDFAPLVGKTGVEFEREALLMFYNALNEQRHLVGVMVGRETDPALRKFLETTKVQLEARYTKVGALLNRRYFTH
jgi:hypothetical protein